jgi:hypothetical protein
MAAGQDSFAGGYDVPAVRAVEDRIERRGVDAGRVHAGLLRDVLELHSLHLRAGMSLMTPTQVALLLRCSESRATRLLTEACGLSELPGGFEALETGLLQPEQCFPLVNQLSPLSLPQQLELWQRLQRNRETGGALPPARLADLLKKWVIEIVPQDATKRRKQGEEERRVEYRRRDDGLADIFLIGIRAADAQAVLQKIREASAPVTLWDERTADQRRLDAAVDLILGRDVLGTGRLSCRGGAGCGCRPGEAAPCGATIVVHVPLNAALGTTDEAAEMVGHGPIEPDLLKDLMLNNPTLRPLFVDEHGVPVGMGTAQQARRPQRGNETELREMLLELADMRPSRLFPRDPDDHGPPDAPSSHPPSAPAPYVVTGLLRELIFARAPRCELPGCGVRAAHCDADHDIAHPAGPTCSCNNGPCCRRHHRVKQLGWTKTRHRDGSITWTDPGGRAWLAPSQHTPPAAPIRPLPPVPVPDPLDQLDPTERELLLWQQIDDPAAYELRAQDHEPEQSDPFDQDRDTRWSLDLDNPYPWLPDLDTAV